MVKLDSAPPVTMEQHECESKIDGDIITYFCRECPDYQRTFNLKTGEMKVKNSNDNISHSGRLQRKADIRSSANMN